MSAYVIVEIDVHDPERTAHTEMVVVDGVA